MRLIQILRWFKLEPCYENILIAGGAGFAGSHLARALLSLGYPVTGLDVAPPAHTQLLTGELGHPRFRYIWKSLQDIQPADLEGHSVVVHLAAQADTPMAFDSPRYTVMQNVDGTVALPEAVRRAGCVKQLIYAGAGNELGRPLYLPIDEEHPLTPHNPYGFSKAAAELALWAWHGAYGVPSIVMSTGAWSSDGRRAGSVHLQVVVERAARLAHPSGGRAADPGRVLHRRRGGCLDPCD